tara:strand:- start:1865 stop:2098 length:234 start_codon:yes stop_codon:yes gene_type:complete
MQKTTVKTYSLETFFAISELAAWNDSPHTATLRRLFCEYTRSLAELGGYLPEIADIAISDLPQAPLALEIMNATRND